MTFVLLHVRGVSSLYQIFTLCQRAWKAPCFELIMYANTFKGVMCAVELN